MVSAKATIVAPNNMLLQSLAACPVPDLPHEITRAPILSSSDSTSLGIVSLPPTMKVRVPASAPTTPDKKRDQSLYTPLDFIFCFCKGVGDLHWRLPDSVSRWDIYLQILVHRKMNGSFLAKVAKFSVPRLDQQCCSR